MTDQLTKLAYSPTEAARIAPVGLTTLYSMMNGGRLRYKQVAGKRIIPASELHRVFCELDTAPEDKAA